MINYYLKDRPTGDVTLSLLDSQGQVIRTFSSAGVGLIKVPAAAGSNRFTWDLRYPGARIIPGTTLHGRPDGPLAPPGTYQVKLTLNGQTYTQSFQIIKDPRLTYTDADLVEQHKFLMAVRDKLTETHEAVRKIRELRKQLEETVKTAQGKSNAEAVTQAAKAINDKLYAIEERLSQYRAKATQDLTNYPVGIDDKLVMLASFAGKADAPPTKQSYDLFKDLAARVARQVAALQEVMQTDWAALGRQMH